MSTRAPPFRRQSVRNQITIFISNNVRMTRYRIHARITYIIVIVIIIVIVVVVTVARRADRDPRRLMACKYVSRPSVVRGPRARHFSSARRHRPIFSTGFNYGGGVARNEDDYSRRTVVVYLWRAGGHTVPSYNTRARIRSIIISSRTVSRIIYYARCSPGVRLSR